MNHWEDRYNALADAVTGFSHHPWPHDVDAVLRAAKRAATRARELESERDRWRSRALELAREVEAMAARERANDDAEVDP